MPPLTQIANAYGHKPNRSEYICCPFHAEKTASCKLYRDHFVCFGCGEHGDAIDFVGKLYSLTPIEACRKINDDFSLGLSLDRETPTEEICQRERITRAKELFNDWREGILNMIDAAIRVANTARFDSLGELTEAEALAIRWRDALEYWSDVLLHRPLSEQMQIFRERTEVDKLCQTILKNTARKSNAA